MELFALFQTDPWGTKSTRFLYGVYETILLAKQAAEENDLDNSYSAIEIIPITLNKFEEL